jgi:hypothetical protein
MRFGARLRADLDVDRLASEIGQVVAATVQPAHVALWIRRHPEVP